MIFLQGDGVDWESIPKILEKLKKEKIAAVPCRKNWELPWWKRFQIHPLFLLGIEEKVIDFEVYEFYETAH